MAAGWFSLLSSMAAAASERMLIGPIVFQPANEITHKKIFFSCKKKILPLKHSAQKCFC